MLRHNRGNPPRGVVVEQFQRLSRHLSDVRAPSVAEERDDREQICERLWTKPVRDEIDVHARYRVAEVGTVTQIHEGRQNRVSMVRDLCAVLRVFDDSTHVERFAKEPIVVEVWIEAPGREAIESV